MGWEQRPGGHYYYSKRRVNGRVVSEYVGNGFLAEMLAEQVEAECEERQAKLEAWRAELAAEQAIDDQVAEACELARSVATAALLVAGYHQHEGTWRKRRTDGGEVDGGAGFGADQTD
jgi:hypothetical protein